MNEVWSESLWCVVTMWTDSVGERGVCGWKMKNYEGRVICCVCVCGPESGE